MGDKLASKTQPETVEHYRRCIAACICPECGAGPFKSMPGHASRVCGISKEEMRRRAEIPASASISSPELASEAAERAKARGAAGSLVGYVDSIRGVSVRRDLPDYSRQRISENMQQVNNRLSPEERSAKMATLARTQSQASRKKQAESLAKWHEANPRSEEERRARYAILNTPEVVAKREAAALARRQPCGTAASYKRGCRCDRCKQAKRVSRGAR